MNKVSIALVGIVLMSLALRLYNLGELPGLLNRDEAALGYNAYLLSQTGKDEWGRSWPLALESFGDYKLLGYPLLTILSITIFGLSDFAVRLPSALAGTGLVVVTFLLIKTLTKNAKLSFVVATTVAVTPIFFFYSRSAFEANVALTAFLSSLVCFIKASKMSSTKRILVLDTLGLVFFTFSLLTYNTPLVLAPVLIFGLPLLRGIKNWQRYIAPTTGMIVVSIFFTVALANLSIQKSGITIFQDETTRVEYTQWRQQYIAKLPDMITNKYIYYTLIIAQNTVESFSPKFIVEVGGNHPWHSQPGFGHLTWAQYIVAIIGLIMSAFTIWRRKQSFLKNRPSIRSILARITEPLIASKTALALCSLIILPISLIPAVVTVDAPHATRSLLFIYVLTVYSAVGFMFLLKKAKSLGFLVATMAIAGFAGYIQAYFMHYPAYQPGLFGSNYDQILTQLDQHYPSNRIAVVDKTGYQYMLTAWYTKMEPELYFSSVVRQLPDRIGFRYGQQVGRYHFVAEAKDREQNENPVLEQQQNGSWKIVQY